MKRRRVALIFMALFWAALVPHDAATQAQTKMAHIGWLSRLGPTATDRNLEAFRSGMRELGYAEGHTFTMESRYSDGRAERMPALAVDDHGSAER